MKTTSSCSLFKWLVTTFWVWAITCNPGPTTRRDWQITPQRDQDKTSPMWHNAGPSSATLAQHWANIAPTYCVCWDGVTVWGYKMAALLFRGGVWRLETPANIGTMAERCSLTLLQRQWRRPALNRHWVNTTDLLTKAHHLLSWILNGHSALCQCRVKVADVGPALTDRLHSSYTVIAYG